MRSQLLPPVFSLILLAFTQACDKSTARNFGADPTVRDFFDEPLADWTSNFNNYDVEKQYAIFIYGNQIIHPPATFLDRPFAMRGASAVPLLKEKLRTADDPTTRDIIRVLAQMAKQGTYDVAADADLMKVITNSVSRIQDEWWRGFVRQKVDAIQQPVLLQPTGEGDN